MSQLKDSLVELIRRTSAEIPDDVNQSIIASLEQEKKGTLAESALKMRERIGKKTEVARDEGFQAEDDLRECGEHQQREEDAKARRRRNFLGESRLAVRLHAQIKTGGGGKCNCAQLTRSPRGLTLSPYFYEPIA